MAKIKPYRVGEKDILHRLALAFTAAEIEQNVIKPQYEKENKKQYQNKGGYLDIYLKSDPKAQRAWKSLQREIKKVRADYLAYAKKENDNGRP